MNNWWHKITWGARLCYFISDEENFTPRGSKIGASIYVKRMNGDDVNNTNERGRISAKQKSSPMVKTGVTM